MKLVRLSSWGMCAVVLALLVIASTRPKASQSLAAPFQGRAAASTQPVNPEEWAKVGDWMRANNCARRYEFINNRLPGPFKARAEQLITERFRNIQRVMDPDLHKALVAELQAQDQIFWLQIEYRWNRRQREKPMAEMKAAVEKLIDAQVAERNARLAHLQTEVNDLLKRKNSAQYITQQAMNYFKNAEAQRQLRSRGELGAENSDESSDADVAH